MSFFFLQYTKLSVFLMFGSPFVVNWCLYFTSAAQLSNSKRLQVSRFGSHFRCSIEVMCSGEEKRSLRQKFHYRLLRKISQLLKLLLDNSCKQSACNTFTDKSSLSYRNRFKKGHSSHFRL